MVVNNCEWETEGSREFSESIIYDFFTKSQTWLNIHWCVLRKVGRTKSLSIMNAWWSIRLSFCFLSFGEHLYQLKITLQNVSCSCSSVVQKKPFRKKNVQFSWIKWQSKMFQNICWFFKSMTWRQQLLRL